MLGVVLWSDASDRKAVIWCEDQGDLAFVNASDGYDTVLHHDSFFDAGDLLQFDMKVKDQTRRATNTRLLVEKAATALPDILRHESRDVPVQSAQVTDLASRRRGYGAGASETQMLRSAVGN